MTRYPKKLYHIIPSWVKPGSTYHIRIRCHPNNSTPLINPKIGPELLNSVEYYQSNGKWHCRLFMLMPDHLHALIAFPQSKPFAEVVGDWKRFHSRNGKIQWQGNFFDHRIRNERELEEKAWYIRMNPVVKGLCEKPGDWPWVFEASATNQRFKQ